MLENTGVYVCTICGFVYIGDTPPEICPVCKVPNWKFEKVEAGFAEGDDLLVIDEYGKAQPLLEFLASLGIQNIT